MKNKGIWLVMVGIIAIGILITTCTTIFVEKQEILETPFMEASMEEETTAINQERMRAVPDAQPQVMEAAPQAEAITEEAAANKANEETMAVVGAETIQSPLETASPQAELAQGLPAKQNSPVNDSIVVAGDMVEINYRVRLEELDTQIQKIRLEGTESTNYSLKAAAENELKLWDGGLNAIYNDIMKQMTEEEATALVTEEREWMKKRDATAVEAAKKSAGGTLEGLEYTASLATSTRERAYQLANLYAEITE